MYTTTGNSANAPMMEIIVDPSLKPDEWYLRQKPNEPREWWRQIFEEMDSPIDKFKFLCGLKNLSWNECQDAWFESQKLMPEIAAAYDLLQKKLEIAIHALELYSNKTFYEGGHNTDEGSSGADIDNYGSAARKALKDINGITNQED